MSIWIDMIMEHINVLGFGFDIPWIILALVFAIVVTNRSLSDGRYTDTAMLFMGIIMYFFIFDLMIDQIFLFVSIVFGGAIVFWEILGGKG